MTGAVGMPDDPQEPPIETEGVGEDPGTLPEHDSVTPAVDDDQDDPEAVPDSRSSDVG